MKRRPPHSDVLHFRGTTMALLALVWLTTSRLTAWPCGSNPAQAKRVAHVSLGSRYLAIMLCARLPPAGLHLRATDGTLSYLGACFELTQGTAPWPCHCVGINLNPSAYFAYPWAQIADSQICSFPGFSSLVYRPFFIRAFLSLVQHT